MKIPLIDRKDVQDIIKSDLSNQEKASLIYKKIHEDMRMANDGLFDMPCFESDIIAYLESL